jgi:hypothetical protein
MVEYPTPEEIAEAIAELAVIEATEAAAKADFAARQNTEHIAREREYELLDEDYEGVNL